MKLRRGWIWYLAGLLLAVVAGIIAVLALRQAVPSPAPAAPATRPVIVAKQNIDARQVIVLDAIEAKDFVVSAIPSGAIFRVEDAVGKFLLQPVAAGQPLLAQNLIALSPGGGGAITTTSKLAALLPTDKLGVVLPATDLLGKSGEVDTGDHVDVLVSLSVNSSGEGKGGQVTLMTLQNVPVVKLLRPITPSSDPNKPPTQGAIQGLVVALDPQDAVTLKYLVDAGANISLSLRPPQLRTIFDLVPVTINYLADRFGIKAPTILP